MAILDIFENDAFSVNEMVASIDKIPYKPGYLGQRGIFRKKPISTTIAVVEERNGYLSLVQTSARGTTPTTNPRKNRKLRAFIVPHLAQHDSILADEVQNARAFGTEAAVELLSEKILELGEQIRVNLEVTREFHRFGALCGIVLDADGTSEVYNWFDEFDITEQVVDFNFGTENTKMNCAAVIALIEEALGATTFNGVVGLCSTGFFNALVTATDVVEAYTYWMDGEWNRVLQSGGAGKFVGPNGMPGFVYGGIQFIDAGRQKVGSIDFIPDDTARFFPVGTSIFDEIYAPADYMETVNRPGKEFYLKQERMDFDKGVLLEGQSNPLIMCNRPGALVKGTHS